MPWSIGGLAVAGVVVTHWLAYLISGQPLAADTPGSIHRYWPVVSASGLGALVTVAAGVVLRCGRRPATVPPSLASTVARLVGLQAVGWLALEAGERALLAHHLDGFFTEPVVLVGLVVQVVVAVASALLLAGLHRAVLALVADTLPAAFGQRPLPRPRFVDVVRPRLRMAASGRTLRGPPLP